MKSGFTLFFSFILFTLTSFSQSTYFETSWGGSGNEYARSVRQLADGSIYVFGFSSSTINGDKDYALNKLDRYGNLLWTKYYGGSLDDNGLAMSRTSDGNFIVVGESYSTPTDLDIQIYKLDTSGVVLWSKRYGTSSNESARSITPTTDGGYALAGYKSDLNGFNDGYIIKIDSVGDTLWTKSIGGLDNDYATGIRPTPGGNLFVSADTRSFGAGEYDVELTMLNSLNGNVLWDSLYGDSVSNGTQGTSMSADGTIFIWGETEVTLFSPFDFYIQKTDTLGNLIWKKNFGGIKADAIFSLTELADKSLMLTGYSNSYNTGPNDLVVLKTDSMGMMQWIHTYGDVGIDIGYEIAPSIYNGFLICGQTFQNTDEFYLLHLDTMGIISSVNFIEDQAKNIFYTYPNPCIGFINVGKNGKSLLGKIFYKVFTPAGVLVDKGFVGNGLISLHSTITSGIYFLELIIDSHSERHKIIVEKQD